MKAVKFYWKKEGFEKDEKVLKMKNGVGDEEAILKHKVKARDKNHLTNNKPILDIMSQDKILIP